MYRASLFWKIDNAFPFSILRFCEGKILALEYSIPHTINVSNFMQHHLADCYHILQNKNLSKLK